MNTDISRKTRKILKNMVLSFKNYRLAKNEKQKETKTAVILQPNIKEEILYNSPYERTVIKSFEGITKSKDFETKFLRLTKNLDKTSINTVVKILKRQEKILSNPGTLDLYTKEEKKELIKIKESYENHFLQISDNLFCYESFLLPENRFEVGVFYHKNGINEIENLEKIRNKEIIDVGAYIGDTAIVFSPYTVKNVFAFECISKNFENMEKTIKLNNCTNIIPVQLALGASKGEAESYICDSASGLVGDNIPKETCLKENIKMTTLDSYVEENSLDVGLIKVDIEGFEQEFLKGAQQTIKAQKPTLLISIYHNADDFFNIKPLIESWNLGYKFKIYKPIDYTISREVLLIAEI